MVRRQEALIAIVAKDPDVAGFGSAIGAGVAGQTSNTGRLFIALKPWGERTKGTAMDFIARTRRAAAQVEGINLFMQAAQDIRVGARLSRTQYEYTLQSADLAELYEWAPKILAKLRGMDMLRDVATDQQVTGTTATLTIDRDQAARFGIQPQVINDTLYNAFGQRQIGQYFTQVNTYRIILEVLREMQDDLADRKSVV